MELSVTKGPYAFGTTSPYLELSLLQLLTILRVQPRSYSLSLSSLFLDWYILVLFPYHACLYEKRMSLTKRKVPHQMLDRSKAALTTGSIGNWLNTAITRTLNPPIDVSGICGQICMSRAADTWTDGKDDNQA